MSGIEPGRASPGGPDPRDGAAATPGRLGELLVLEGLITPDQLDEALRTQAAAERYTPLGQILLDRKVLTRTQLVSVLKRHRKQLRLGDFLVRARVITADRLQGALSYQRRIGLRLGDALLQLGLVTEAHVRQALCSQLNIPFLDLEHFRPDPDHGLDRLISRVYALSHRLVPITRIGNSLTIVMDDPTDEAVVQELEALTGCTIAVATAWRKGIERAMSRIYPTSPSPRATSRWRERGPRDS